MNINIINYLIFQNNILPILTVKNILYKLNLPVTGNIYTLNYRLKQYYIKLLFNNNLNKNIFFKNNNNNFYNNISIVSYSKQGRRNYMEDKMIIKNNNEHIYAAVYDGHGGITCANYLTRMLYKNILYEKKKYNNNNINNITKILKTAFRKTDNDFLKLNKKSGSTANIIFIDKKTNLFYIANTGDSRSFLCNNNNHIYPLSIDHKPNNIKEKKRILKLPNSFIIDNRINGILAMSRSFGDKSLKQWVIVKPDIFYGFFKNIKFIVLATDGLYDVMSNYEISLFIIQQLKNNINKNDIVKNLVNHAIYVKNSYDNVSIIIIFT